MHRLHVLQRGNPLPFTPAHEHGGGASICRPRVFVANVDGEELDEAKRGATLGDILKMVEVDYAANGRKSLARVKHAATHLKEFFDACTKTRVITSDRISAYQAERLGQGAKPATVKYELAVLRRAFRLGGRAGKVAVRPEIQMLHVENTRKGFFEPEQ
jgi:hypothetical protein